MADQNLQELLEKLQDELQRTEVTDEAGRERLRHLEADIRRLRERSGEKPEADEPMLERFQDTMDHFEETYPQLTLMISEMMTILSNAGI
jgi:predicted nuclease with TOPRIM domain